MREETSHEVLLTYSVHTPECGLPRNLPLSIMNQTGHPSLTTVRRYIRDGNLFRENAADGLGL